MGHDAVAAVWASYRGPATPKYVLLALAERADRHDWSCYPSVADLARRTSLTPRTVQRALDRLEAEGAITRGRYAGAKSRQGSPTNLYNITVRKGDTVTPFDGL